MNFRDLLYQHRKTEPTSVLVMRRIFIIILSAVLLAYIVFLGFGIHNEVPNIASHVESSQSALAPSLKIFSRYQFRLTCCIMSSDKSADQRQLCDSCQQHIERNGNVGIFKPNNLMLSVIGATHFMLYVTFIEQVTDTANPSMIFRAYGTESFLTNSTDTESSPFISSLSSLNLSSSNRSNCLISQAHLFEYSRKERNELKSSWRNYFGIGFGDPYTKIPYIESKMETFPMYNNTEEDLWVMIIPMNNNIIVETEQRSKTILGSIGTIGGAWGLVTALYALLFGFDSIKPWGFVQNYCYGTSKTSKNKLKKDLPIIPFVDRKDSFNDSYDHKNIKNDSNNSDNYVTRQELESLLTYLKDYVVDVSSLEDLAKRTT